MTVRSDDDNLVMIRMPRRTAEVFDANLEIATSPKALKRQLVGIRVLEAICACIGLYVLLTLAAAASLPEPVYFGEFLIGAVVATVAFGLAYAVHRTGDARKKAFRARGLI